MTPFGSLPGGRQVGRVTIESRVLQVSLLDLGAIIQDVRLAGVGHPLVLGGAVAASYAGIMSHFGAVIGPVANRIAGAEAHIDGKLHRFEANEGRNTRHSGSAGTHLKTWMLLRHEPDSALFRIDLPDGEGGFPGNRRITAAYRVEGATLSIELTGTTDAPTLMNLVSHPYWALQPPEAGRRGLTLRVYAEHYLPVTGETLPTGEIAPVAGTGFDFRAPRPFGDDDPALDHNFCLASAPRNLAPAAHLGSSTGITLVTETTAPGLQIFDMTPFGVTEPTIHGMPYPPRAGLAIEPQHWPDAPGRDGWPDITLRPGETFRQLTRHVFGAPTNGQLP